MLRPSASASLLAILSMSSLSSSRGLSSSALSSTPLLGASFTPVLGVSPSPSAPSLSSPSPAPDPSSSDLPSTPLPSSLPPAPGPPSSALSSPTLSVAASSPRSTTIVPTPSSADDSYAEATQLTVKSPPTICTSDFYSYETKMSVPTGFLLIEAGYTGWGEPGSIWDISTGLGASLTEMEAHCAGSICGKNSANRLNDGEMIRRADGSWYLNVTADMQSTVKIVGQVVNNGTAKQRRGDKRKYPLKVSGTPPCGLPIAKNCTDKDFSGSRDQWAAYSTNDYLDWYLKKNKITSFTSLRKQSFMDATNTWDGNAQRCDITGDVSQCEVPKSHYCQDHPTYNQTRTMLVAAASINYSVFLSKLWKGAERLVAPLLVDIDEIVKFYWVPAAKQTWQKISTITSATMGILVAAAITIAALIPEAYALIGGLLTAVAVAAQTSVAMAGSIGNLRDPGTSDAQFEHSTDMKTQARDVIRGIQQNLLALHTNETSASNITQVLGGGVWTEGKVAEAYNQDGWGDDTVKWLEKVMVPQFISSTLKDNGAYIMFVPYSHDMKNWPTKGKHGKFDKESCEKNFVNNPRWKYFAVCDLTFGPEGDAGMSLITRPDKQGAESKSWMKPFPFRGSEITGGQILSSAIYGQAIHGFDYKMLNEDLMKDVSEDISSAKKVFSEISPDYPGLYDIPVCIVTNILYIPNIAQAHKDQKGAPWEDRDYTTYSAPCSCADFRSDKGKKEKFVDFVTKGARDSFDDCTHKDASKGPK